MPRKKKEEMENPEEEEFEEEPEDLEEPGEEEEPIPSVDDIPRKISNAEEIERLKAKLAVLEEKRRKQTFLKQAPTRFDNLEQRQAKMEKVLTQLFEQVKNLHDNFQVFTTTK